MTQRMAHELRVYPNAVRTRRPGENGGAAYDEWKVMQDFDPNAFSDEVRRFTAQQVSVVGHWYAPL